MQYIDLTDEIEVEDAPLCPLCDQPVTSNDAFTGYIHSDFGKTYFLVCSGCIDNLLEGDQ